MKLKTLCIAAALVAGSHFSYAAGSTTSSDNVLSPVECTEINADHLHLSCKAANGEGAQSELNASLINYDVKNSEGEVINSGYGTTVYVDNSKLQSQEEYTVVVYAVVNGNVVSQTVNRHAPAK
jgi:hypothetical protein